MWRVILENSFWQNGHGLHSLDSFIVFVVSAAQFLKKEKYILRNLSSVHKHWKNIHVCIVKAVLVRLLP